jgi:hypothetical protein
MLVEKPEARSREPEETPTGNVFFWLVAPGSWLLFLQI